MAERTNAEHGLIDGITSDLGGPRTVALRNAAKKARGHGYETGAADEFNVSGERLPLGQAGESDPWVLRARDPNDLARGYFWEPLLP